MLHTQFIQFFPFLFHLILTRGLRGYSIVCILYEFPAIQRCYTCL